MSLGAFGVVEYHIMQISHSRGKAQLELRSLARLSKEVKELKRQVLIAEQAQLRQQIGKPQLRASARRLSIATSLENTGRRTS